MAVVKPFRAIRYDEAVAGPLETLVAPPYDVISPEQREELRDRSPHNVVRLTLPDSEDEAARELERWRDEGALVEEPPAIWALEQEYVGPDGIERTRFGLVASLKVEPYETGTVLPHERTHAGPKEGRLRLLRAAAARPGGRRGRRARVCPRAGRVRPQDSGHRRPRADGGLARLGGAHQGRYRDRPGLAAPHARGRHDLRRDESRT